MKLEIADIESLLARIRAAERQGAQLQELAAGYEERIASLEAAKTQSEGKIAALETRIAQIESRQALQGAAFPAEKISRKYRGLALFLFNSQQDTVLLTYGQIEEKLGFALPPTAYNLPQSYWANTAGHSYSSAWMAVGYKARIQGGNTPVQAENRREKTVLFERELP